MPVTQRPQGSARASAATGEVTLYIGSNIGYSLRTVQASKAALSLLSSVLKDAFAKEPSRKTLTVDGSLEAWRFVATFLSSTPSTRLVAHTEDGALLLAEVLAVAEQYDMPRIVEEIVAAVKHRLTSSFCTLHLDFKFNPNKPNCPVWWINLADKYGRMELAVPAVRALMRDAVQGNRRRWSMMVLPLARESKGTSWQTIAMMIEALMLTA